MQVRRMGEADRESWLNLRQLLWPTEDVAQLRDEVETFLAERETWGLFIAEIDDRPAGFAECRLRDTAAGCVTTPVGYLEAWYVEPARRRQAVGAALMKRCEGWARERGATEIASDTTDEYPESLLAHVALGFERLGDSLRFRKSIALRS